MNIHLLYLEPNKMFNFSNNTLLITKLTYNVNLLPLNGTNPYYSPPSGTKYRDHPGFQTLYEIYYNTIKADPEKELDKLYKLYCKQNIQTTIYDIMCGIEFGITPEAMMTIEYYDPTAARKWW